MIEIIALTALVVQISFGALGVLFFILIIGSEIEKRRREKRFIKDLEKGLRRS